VLLQKENTILTDGVFFLWLPTGFVVSKLRFHASNRQNKKTDKSKLCR